MNPDTKIRAIKKSVQIRDSDNMHFKQTEVGMIPEDWEMKQLCDISEIRTGNTPPTTDVSNYGEVYLFVTPADLGKKRLITKTEKKLSAKGFSISRKFPRHSILFTCIGSTIGKSGMAPFDLTSNQQINAVLPNQDFDSRFVYYILNLFSKKIKESAGETAVPIINKTKFGEVAIPLPPTKAEQTAIATTNLSDNSPEEVKPFWGYFLSKIWNWKCWKNAFNHESGAFKEHKFG